MATSSASSVTRIVVESPFGSNKCDYSIDKSQRGRLVVTARRPRSHSSSHHSSNDKNHLAVQTFTIPMDADVDRLQSHVERNTNRLIIEIPRQQQQQQQQQRTSYRPSRSSFTNSSAIVNNLIRSPDVERMLTSPTGGPQLVRENKSSGGKRSSGGSRKLEYRIDCHGYAADELEVFIQGRDLMVHGQTRTSTSGNPGPKRVSKKFTRKISLPNTVDLPGVVSYLERGELRVEAPLKRGVYYSDEEIIVPGPPPPSTSNRATSTLINNLENRVLSPPPPPSASSSRYQYRRNDRTARQRDYDRGDRRQTASPAKRVRSVEALRYPLYVSPRELDEDEEREDQVSSRNGRTRRRQNGDQQRQFVRRKEVKSQPVYRSIYTPINHLATSRTASRQQNYNSDDDSNYLRF